MLHEFLVLTLHIKFRVIENANNDSERETASPRGAGT